MAGMRGGGKVGTFGCFGKRVLEIRILAWSFGSERFGRTQEKKFEKASEG